MFDLISLAKARKRINIVKKYKFSLTNSKNRGLLCLQINQILRDHHITIVHDEYNRALGNALAHGACPIKFRLYIGENKEQCLFVIRDSGQGFDYKTMIHKFKSKQKYYNFQGHGTQCYAKNKHLNVSWQDQGRTILLAYNL